MKREGGLGRGGFRGPGTAARRPLSHGWTNIPGRRKTRTGTGPENRSNPPSGGGPDPAFLEKTLQKWIWNQLPPPLAFFLEMVQNFSSASNSNHIFNPYDGKCTVLFQTEFNLEKNYYRGEYGSALEITVDTNMGGRNRWFAVFIGGR